MAENDRSDPVSDITTRILNGRPPDGDEADGYTEEEYFDRYWDLGDAKPGTIRCCYDSITGRLLDVTIAIGGREWRVILSDGSTITVDAAGPRTMPAASTPSSSATGKSINRIEPADPPSDGEVPCAEILDLIRTHGGAAAIDKYGAAHVRAAMIPED